jgi:hypothetical protein
MKRFLGLTIATPLAFGQNELLFEDVQKMLAAQVPEEVIVLKVKQTGKPFNLSSDDIIALKKSGASDQLLKALLDPTSRAGNSAEMPAIVISDGTEVKLLLTNPLSSATAQPEQRIEFSVADTVVVRGLTVIEKGAPAAGHVTEVEARKSFGRKGKLLFSVDTVQAVSGENIRLRASKAASGTDSYGKAGVVTILIGPLGALVKGKDVEVAAGTVFTIYIDGDRKVAVAPVNGLGSASTATR